MDPTAYTEPQCLYRVYFTFLFYMIVYEGKQCSVRKQDFLSSNSKNMCESWIGFNQLADLIRGKACRSTGFYFCEYLN